MVAVKNLTEEEWLEWKGSIPRCSICDDVMEEIKNTAPKEYKCKHEPCLMYDEIQFGTTH